MFKVTKKPKTPNILRDASSNLGEAKNKADILKAIQETESKE